MLSTYVVQMVERSAERITSELVDDILSNPRTTSFRTVSREELEQRVGTIYRHLGDWLGGRSDEEIESAFGPLGRERCHQGVPIEELVYALILTKRHLRNRIRSVSAVSSAGEMHSEMELGMMIGLFFDRVLYAVVKGYEDARRAVGRRPAGRKIDGPRTAVNLRWVP